ncbi:Unsaturated glucuronyl hydrolase [compost metagenome]
MAYWDFDDPAIPATSRDTSGTAIAAAALLKLAVCLPERRERYQQAAEAMVEALVLRYLTPLDGNDPRPVGILTHGCFNRKLGVAMENELIWGDYFLFEALLVLAASLASERV